MIQREAPRPCPFLAKIVLEESRFRQARTYHHYLQSIPPSCLVNPAGKPTPQEYSIVSNKILITPYGWPSKSCHNIIYHSVEHRTKLVAARTSTFYNSFYTIVICRCRLEPKYWTTGKTPALTYSLTTTWHVEEKLLVANARALRLLNFISFRPA